MKRFLTITTICALLCGCDNDWRLQHVPTTDAERKAVAEYEQQAIASLRVQSLAGNDQDWDDTLHVVHRNACETLCRPTLWEYPHNGYSPTGRWRYIDEPMKEASK